MSRGKRTCHVSTRYPVGASDYCGQAIGCEGQVGEAVVDVFGVDLLHLLASHCR